MLKKYDFEPMLTLQTSKISSKKVAITHSSPSLESKGLLYLHLKCGISGVKSKNVELLLIREKT